MTPRRASLDVRVAPTGRTPGDRPLDFVFTPQLRPGPGRGRRRSCLPGSGVHRPVGEVALALLPDVRRSTERIARSSRGETSRSRRDPRPFISFGLMNWERTKGARVLRPRRFHGLARRAPGRLDTRSFSTQARLLLRRKRTGRLSGFNGHGEGERNFQRARGHPSRSPSPHTSGRRGRNTLLRSRSKRCTGVSP